jgi:L-alanine-DL-glutamate epimerase-like enolase superfamily enzyme
MDVQRILVRVTARDGVTGTGEGVVPGDPWWGGESVERMQLAVERYLTPLLLGRRVDDIAGIKRATNDVVTANPARRPPSRPPCTTRRLAAPASRCLLPRGLHQPDGPGLGVELDPAAVAGFTRT